MPATGEQQPYGTLNDSWEIEYDSAGQIVRVYWCLADGSRILHFERPGKDATFHACRKSLLKQLTEAIVRSLQKVGTADEIYALVLSHCEADYQERLPPNVGVGLVSERRRFVEERGLAARGYIWNPAEWESGELSLQLPDDLASLCASVNQDIWQNELQEEADQFLLDLARSLNNADLPFRLADNFVTVVVSLDLGNFAAQIAAQIDKRTARKLRADGLL